MTTVQEVIDAMDEHSEHSSLKDKVFGMKLLCLTTKGTVQLSTAQKATLRQWIVSLQQMVPELKPRAALELFHSMSYISLNQVILESSNGPELVRAVLDRVEAPEKMTASVRHQCL